MVQELELELELALGLADFLSATTSPARTVALSVCQRWAAVRWLRCTTMREVVHGLAWVTAEEQPLMRYDREQNTIYVFELCFAIPVDRLDPNLRSLCERCAKTMRQTTQLHTLAFSKASRVALRQRLCVHQFVCAAVAGIELAFGAPYRAACEKGKVACPFYSWGTELAAERLQSKRMSTAAKCKHQSSEAILQLCKDLLQHRSAVAVWAKRVRRAKRERRCKRKAHLTGGQLGSTSRQKRSAPERASTSIASAPGAPAL